MTEDTIILKQSEYDELLDKIARLEKALASTRKKLTGTKKDFWFYKKFGY